MQIHEHSCHLRAIEAAGQFVETTPASLGIKRSQFVQFVEAEGHDCGECALVNFTHKILQEERGVCAAICFNDRKMVGNRHLLLGFIRGASESI